MKNLDLLKWLLAGSFIVAGILGYYFLSEQLFVYRLLFLLFCIITSLPLVFMTSKGKFIWNFFKESRLELKKIIWPAKHEVTRMTLIIIFVVILASCFIWIIDSILAKIIAWLLG